MQNDEKPQIENALAEFDLAAMLGVDSVTFVSESDPISSNTALAALALDTDTKND